jgi:cytochrome P450
MNRVWTTGSTPSNLDHVCFSTLIDGSVVVAAPDILSPEFANDPYQAYRHLRDDFPLLWHAPTQSYVLSRYDDVKQAFRDGDVFGTENYDWQLEPVHGRTILQLSGREHAQRRGLVTPAFRGNVLQETFLPVIERDARELIDAFGDGGTVDLVSDFATWFPINVIVDMLALNRADRERFHVWYTAIIAFLSNLAQDPEVTAAGLRTHDELEAYMLPVIRDRRANLGDDLLSRLCSAEVDGATMSDEEIKAFVSLLLAAGGETTAHALPGMFRNLLEHPDQLAAVRADRSLIAAAFAETLRHTPPVQMIMRKVRQEVTLSGGVVPAGTTVTCLIGAANRDDRRYRDPEVFNIFRDDLTTANAFSAAADHVAFALGAHFCVGALLAKAEVDVAANQLLDAMPEMRLEEGFVPREKGIFTRGLESLPVRFTPASV